MPAIADGKWSWQYSGAGVGDNGRKLPSQRDDAGRTLATDWVMEPSGRARQYRSRYRISIGRRVISEQLVKLEQRTVICRRSFMQRYSTEMMNMAFAVWINLPLARERCAKASAHHMVCAKCG